MSFSETCVKSNVVYNGKIVKLHCDEASLPNGKLCTREYVEHGGGSCVLFVKDNKILLVRQFRYPYGEELWELPAGKLNAGRRSRKYRAAGVGRGNGVYSRRTFPHADHVPLRQATQTKKFISTAPCAPRAGCRASGRGRISQFLFRARGRGAGDDRERRDTRREDDRRRAGLSFERQIKKLPRRNRGSFMFTAYLQPQPHPPKR